MTPKMRSSPAAIWRPTSAETSICLSCCLLELACEKSIMMRCGRPALPSSAPDASTLREIAEKLRDKLGDAIVCVGAAQGPKAALVVTVSKSLTDRFKAGDLIKKVAEVVGGSGGGRPDMAQAGGTQVDKLDDALTQFWSLVS